MDFSAPPRRRPAENLLPMINVVFLLLIFFLVAAELSPPEPFAVTPPEAGSDTTAEGQFTLLLSPEGVLGYRDQIGEAQALAALETERTQYCGAEDCTATPPKLMLRADASVAGASVAGLLGQIGALGFTEVQLVTERP